MNSSILARQGFPQARSPPCAFFPEHNFLRLQPLKKVMTELVN